MTSITLLVKIPADWEGWREPGEAGKFRYGQLELRPDGSYTYWPLSAYGLRIGSAGKGEIDFPFRVLRRAKERREWEKWAERAERQQPMMQFHCHRCADGAVEVQNIIAGGCTMPMMGQRHTHTPPMNLSFGRLKWLRTEAGSRTLFG